MGVSPVGKFQKGALRWLEMWFKDPELVRTITYSLYKGRLNKGATTSTQSFSLLAVLTKERILAQLTGQVDHQTSARKYIIRTSDLVAEGVTQSQLNKNDNITDDDGDFSVVNVDRTLGFVVVIVLHRRPMTEFSANLQYPESLKRLSKISQDATDVALRDTERLLLRRVKSGTPIGETGDLWDGWAVVAERYGFTLENQVPYASYVEVGGPHMFPGDERSNWPRVGPRTRDVGGTIWSRQAVGGMVAPIQEDKEWLVRCVDRIVSIVERSIQGG